jgi:hypothetical protein
MEKADKSIGCYLYPGKIVIVSRFQKDASTWYNTANVSVLSPSSSDAALGAVSRNHLHQSKKIRASNEDLMKNFKEFKKAAKFKTDRAFIENARCVVIFVFGNKIRFEPLGNRSSDKIFYGLPNAIYELNSIPDAETLGREIRRAWTKCVFFSHESPQF